VVKDYQKTSTPKVKCSRGMIIGSLMNIIDNSIWWLEYGKTEKKKIFIRISAERAGYLTIIIADNGPGFSLPTEDLAKPFVSAKPDGMGLGLHIVDEIMKGHGGNLLFPESNDFDIPEEFKQGAIVCLSFKTEE
jgi:nitrogen fixation/metabolism regulation signal transduction histidine kinase